MVIKMDIENFSIHKVLVDNGSSADIIFWDVLRRMNLENANLDPVQTPLVRFGGSEVTSLGSIDLSVSIGDEPRRRTAMVKFLVVDTQFAYNVILEDNSAHERSFMACNGEARRIGTIDQMGGWKDEHDIEYQNMASYKAQILTNFIAEFGPGGIELEVVEKFSFATANSEAEYETLILGLELA
ncbi:hypothetical protein Sango_2994600 [Sesamum angolense]|uniref:Uncharacterized protein n=1 Tax=Sesamum angolense TaxID=2727404 RepID=A0AAE1T4Q2_9LAMI|nr:hypothetical protein Sango_2994600 [Sesamum angolense]